VRSADEDVGFEPHSIVAFVTAERAGGSLMLLKRTVFEQMIKAFPATRYTYDFVSRREENLDCFALFDPLVANGEYLPEDYGFCYRWRALGGKIWLDTEGKINHVGMHKFRGQGLPK
jgi:hypothetical protein